MTDTIYTKQKTCSVGTTDASLTVRVMLLREYRSDKKDSVYSGRIQMTYRYFDYYKELDSLQCDSLKAGLHDFFKDMENQDTRIITFGTDELKEIERKMRQMHHLTRSSKDIRGFTTSIDKFTFGTELFSGEIQEIKYILQSQGMGIVISEEDYIDIVDMVSEANAALEYLQAK